MRYALFDLDHTLLPFDTQTLFCNFVLKRCPWRVVLHTVFLPFALLRPFGLTSTATVKRAFLAYLWGMKREKLETLAREFADTCVTTWVYPELRAEILRHHHQGRKLVLNTASPDFYAHEIARTLEFDHCIATPFLVGKRFPLLPRIDGENNKREAKIQRMTAAIPELASVDEDSRSSIWSYSDSPADIPLLDFAGHRMLVHPGGKLKRRYKDDIFTMILRPWRPYATKTGDLFRSLLQIVGCYRDAGPCR